MLAHVVESDAQLVARCRAGDEDAWRELVERFSRYVYAISVQAYRMSESDAEDVFQEVFARAYVNLPKLRDDSAIRPWLAQMTRRLCLDTIRAGAREQPEELPEPPGADDAIAQARRGAVRPRRARHAPGQLPRDPRPLLRPGRELPQHRRRARHPGGHDRQPDFALSRQAQDRIGGRGKKTGVSGVWWLTMRYYDEETLADLLRTLPAPPRAWVQAAQEIPLARKGLDDIVERAREDQAFRDALIADLETALEHAGYETNPALAEAVRARLSL